ncbi:MAG TPA: DUF72 domain-containing protein [Melioribacteraceae bacterium]|nr:DUF72 domain-containing protein [Melioribacteraceae bacterium]
MEKLYIGTAGWSYKDWVPSFYPKAQTSQFDWLEYYSSFFNVVEVNSSYYTYINPGIVEGWINKVEDKDDFLFTIKLHQDFTHKRRFTSEQIKAVKYNLDKLTNAGRFGGLLIQFPYSFTLDKENANHVKNLIDIFPEYEKYIEVRHKSWFIQRFFDFLGKNRSSLCTIDQPSIGEAVEFKPLKAGENLYIRFHGRNTKAWKSSLGNYSKEKTYEEQNERYNYLYSPGELVEIEQKIKEVLDTVKKVFVILNNHPKGNAVANALELIHLLNERIKVNIPETTLKAYPRLSKISLN